MKPYVLLILLGGLVFISGCVGQSGPQASAAEPVTTPTPLPAATSVPEPVATPTPLPTKTPAPEPAATPTPTPAPEMQVTGEVREYEIEARQFAFIPSNITVNKGDTVKLRITSVDVPHGFVIDKLGISKKLPPGETVEIEFVADKEGNFSFYCSVPCGEGHREMKGWLFVE